MTLFHRGAHTHPERQRCLLSLSLALSRTRSLTLTLNPTRADTGVRPYGPRWAARPDPFAFPSLIPGCRSA